MNPSPHQEIRIPEAPEIFSKKDTKDKIKKAIEAIENFRTSDELLERVASNTRLCLEFMLENHEYMNSNCKNNINWIGDNFEHYLERLGTKSIFEYDEEENILYEVFTCCARFFFEIRVSTANPLPSRVIQLTDFISNNIEKFPKEAKNSLVYSQQMMSIDIIKQLLTTSGLDNILEFKSAVHNSIELKRNWDKEIKEKEDNLSRLSGIAEGLTSRFNFVGLHEGFRALHEEKTLELKINKRNVALLGSIAIAPIAIQICIIFMSKATSAQPNIHLISLSLGLEILLFYFFRIALQDLKETKNQIVDIKVRMTLCQFIQSYSDYSSEIKKKNKEALERFEKIIFSKLHGDPSKIPSTIDGVDQITDLVKQIKG